MVQLHEWTATGFLVLLLIKVVIALQTGNSAGADHLQVHVI